MHGGLFRAVRALAIFRSRWAATSSALAALAVGCDRASNDGQQGPIARGSADADTDAVLDAGASSSLDSSSSPVDATQAGPASCYDTPCQEDRDCAKCAGWAACGLDAYCRPVCEGDRVAAAIELRATADADEFAGITEVTGDVTIVETNLGSLRAFSCLRSVGGSLKIGTRECLRECLPMGNPSLATLAGLERLERIGNGLQIARNPLLADLTALGGLRETLWLSIWDNGTLTDLAGLEGLSSIPTVQIGDNAALLSLTGLSGVRMIGTWLQISGNASLSTLDGLGPLDQVDEVQINGNPSLSDLSALSRVREITALEISNTALVDLTSLQTLSALQGTVRIHHNPSLASLSGLETLTSVLGDLYLSGNMALSSLQGLAALTTVGGELEISYSSLLSLQGLEALQSIGGLNIMSNEHLETLAGLRLPSTLTGSMSIVENPRLIDVNALAGIVRVDYDVGIGLNGSLVSLSGLETLQSVGGALDIDDNAALSDLSALSGLTQVDAFTSISNNPSLATLHGLEALQSVAWSLMINDNAALTSLEGLGALRSIGQSLHIRRNAALTRLDGLASLSTVSDLLLIQDNPVLPSCEVDALEVRLGKECTGCAPGESWPYCECVGNDGSGLCPAP